MPALTTACCCLQIAATRKSADRQWHSAQDYWTPVASKADEAGKQSWSGAQAASKSINKALTDAQASVNKAYSSAVAAAERNWEEAKATAKKIEL